MKAIALLLACAFLVSPGLAAADVVEDAMAKELARAKNDLKEEGYPPAYYVSLTAIDLDSWEQRCSVGAPYFSGGYTQRLMTPDLRVGDYSLDNHPVSN